jgi:hypothetical protein
LNRDPLFLPFLQFRPVIQTPRFLEDKLLEPVDDVVNAAAGGARAAAAAVEAVLEELAPRPVEPGRARNATAAPVGRGAFGADVFDAHLRNRVKQGRVARAGAQSGIWMEDNCLYRTIDVEVMGC